MRAKYTWADEEPKPRRARVIEDDHAVTYVNGQAFRRETSRHDPDNTIRHDEQRVLGQRAREAAERRRAEAQRNLALAAEVGAALKVLRGEP